MLHGVCHRCVLSGGDLKVCLGPEESYLMRHPPGGNGRQWRRPSLDLECTPWVGGRVLLVLDVYMYR